ncbi:tRNA (5-methylaminomethyl-2-thiouridine)(34)-methyltransferase MnmD [Salinimicrobium sp. MT39]|uniref:tRNA (5-methylaminomethyl-2-thiouridine)(34)-methyltransferase MnmD n=1 Tax=Salinimicrobium profundisediminis TaxID=2994553 RepID=A0A9X3CZ12_9FLAO|nr:tRNA (5-methylaminomethyl-2-thiouridine)(34)-methyltransferase MnmD [Salinimicrobium profundisediminis]MCX2839368.1 tRNA (5-methylaminomethyl-2-thiouridine)(34)-methyltransferase MnmD [Salinimicrobium profundisediminis]
MKREIIKTGDGSSTIFLPDWNEHYHSKHGALQEALHVFIKSGYQFYLSSHEPTQLSILEIGFGTGLNALLTLIEAEKDRIHVNYTGVEAYPVEAEELQVLDYSEVVGEEVASEVFQKVHETPWEKSVEISPFFRLQKEKKFFSEISAVQEFDLIYFDAFGPRVQPDLWSEEVFRNMYAALKTNGVLVTYSAKGDVRRAMQAAGFEVSRLPGPPGKREMLRAVKK